jgi:hypothetical protein
MKKRKIKIILFIICVIAITSTLIILLFKGMEIAQKEMNSGPKPQTFVTELQSLLDTAETQFVSDSMGDMSEWPDGITYARANGISVARSQETGYKILYPQGNTLIDYYIHLNLAGYITEFYATDNEKFQFIYNGPGLKKEKIADTIIEDEDHALSNKALDNPPTSLVVSVTAGTTSSTEINTGVINLVDTQAYLPKKFSRLSLNIVDNGKTGDEKIDNYKCVVTTSVD